MLACIFVGCALHTGGGWTGDLLIADWGELEERAAPESHVVRFRSQDVDVDTCRGYFWHSRVQTERSHEWDTSYLVFHAFAHFSKKMGMREETRTLTEALNFAKMREETLSQIISSVPNLELSSLKLQRRTTISVAWSSGFSYRHHVTPRGQPYVPSVSSFPIPLKYIDALLQTKTNLDEVDDNNVHDDCNVDGNNIFSLDRFRQI